MTKTNKIVFFGIAIVVAILASVVTVSFLVPSSPAVQSAIQQAAPDASLGTSGNVFNSIDYYTNGLGIGNRVEFSQGLTIPPGQNQVSWKNKTGRTIYVTSANIGYAAGTATSSYLFFVGATTTSTFSTDYAHPGPNRLLVDGATIATSSVASALTFFSSTSTSAGNGAIPVPDGSYMVFQVQERYACKTNSFRETATSTNRGISNFIGYFRGWYAQ